MKRTILILLLVTFMIFGCAPAYYKLYTTPLATPGGYITIMTKYENKAFLKSVNGEKISGMREVTVEVPPGPIVIEPLYNDGTYRSVTAYPETYYLIQGHIYVLGARVGEVQKEATMYTSSTNDLFFYMVDQNTKEIVYPTKIDTGKPAPESGIESPSKKESAVDWFSKGLDFSNNKQYEKAVECFDKANTIDPNFIAVYYHRGEAYYNLGKYNEAIKDLSKEISLNESSAWAYYYRGLSYQGLGKKDKALEDFRKACQLGSGDGCTAYDSMK